MKKIFLVSLSILLVAVMVVGGTLAYLTVDAPAFSNVVTVGDVNIELKEKVDVIGSGEVVENANGATYSGVMPGDKLQKEVTVKNIGTKAAYVRVDVNLNNGLLINNGIDDYYEALDYSEAEIQAIYDYVFNGWGFNYTKKTADSDRDGVRLTITGEDMPAKVLKVDTTQTMTDYSRNGVGNWFQLAGEEDGYQPGLNKGYYSKNMGVYERHYAYYMLLNPGEETTLFNGLNVPAEFNKAQLDMFSNLHIDVTASAIQADNIPSLEAYGSEAHAKVAFAILAGDSYPALDAWEDVADTSWYDASTTTFVLDSAEDVAGLSQLVYNGNNFSGKTVKLEANIDLGDKLWTPIGRMINTSGTGENSTFKGTFDGQGYTIYNLNVNTVNDDTDDNNKGAGLFGAITGNIKNLTVKNAKIETAHWAGVIAGSIEGSISNCHVENATLVCLPEYISEWDNGDKAGAIAGYATNGAISDCTVKNVNITAYRDMGAIVGASYNKVENCVVENVRLTKDNTHDYKGTGDDTTVNSYVGTVYGGATVDATGDVVITNAVSYEASDVADIINALESGAENVVIKLEDKAEIKMPSSSTSSNITITGTEDTVVDMTWGAYLETANVTFEGITLKVGTGYVTTDGNKFVSDYAALYSKNVTYRNCTFDGPLRIGRDGATFENCTFDLEGVDDYVWTYGNSVTFKGCTFNTSGKALLIYSDGNGDVSEVSVTDCVFNADKSAKAGAIANQACAAIEIDNYGCGVKLTISGNTVDTDFSGEWRIKSYDSNKDDVLVNGVEYTSIALDGKKMTIDGNKNVTVVE